MTFHPGYFTDSLRGQPWYRCLSCPYDSFLRENIQQHAKANHTRLLWPERGTNELQGNTIGISLLTWNTQDASASALSAIARESRILGGLGVKTHVIWCDNGSTDGTVQRLQEVAGAECLNLAAVSLHATNQGQSAGRNDIIQSALALNCDYLLMVDGDITIAPYSAYSMGNFLEMESKHIGCIGVYCRNCTDDPADVDLTPEFPTLLPYMVDGDPATAWTNYGMFRREVLEKCQFDVGGPFRGAGWGFEDDDYYMQMQVAGFQSWNTKWVRHLHQKRHSSLRLLDASLAAKVYQERKGYVVSKWQDCPDPEVQRIVRLMVNQTMPVLD